MAEAVSKRASLVAALQNSRRVARFTVNRFADFRLPLEGERCVRARRPAIADCANARQLPGQVAGRTGWG